MKRVNAHPTRLPIATPSVVLKWIFVALLPLSGERAVAALMEPQPHLGKKAKRSRLLCSGASWQEFKQLTPSVFERVVFRPRPQPAPSLPMGARSVGHRILQGPQELPRFCQPYHQFIWGVAGIGKIHFDGHPFFIEPEEVTRFQAGDLQWYGTESDRWEFRWWTMDGLQAATMIASFGITWQTPRHVGPCPHELFRQLDRQLREVHPAAEGRAAATVFSLLAEVSGHGYRPHSHLIDEAVGIIDREYTDPLFGVASLAATLRIHRATLARNFADQVGMNPLEYLVSVRVQRALALLKTTTLNVTEVAYRTGFSDPNYFSRSIKRATARTPSEFRSTGHT